MGRPIRVCWWGCDRAEEPVLLPSRRLIGGVAFTLLLIGLIAFATAEAVTYFFVVMPVAVATCVAFFFIVFPGSRFFTIAFANYIGVYACVFAFFKEANFAPVHGWPVAVGFLMPIIAFLAGTWIRRDRIRGIVTSEHVRDGRRLYRVLAWLLPVGAVGAASFFLPALALGGRAWDASLLVAMGLIAVVVLAVSRDVCVFLLDTGLLFEEFFERMALALVPAFAFFTFYSLQVVVFATIYRIVDRFSALPQFIIDGVRRTITFPESLYFSLVTVSTVGYGDIVPHGNAIRLIVGLQIVSGVLLLLFGFSEILGYSRERRPRN